jgi:osmoprotectant transport system permease protein
MSRPIRLVIAPVILLVILVAMSLPGLAEPLLAFLFPERSDVLYDRVPIVRLIGEHLLLVAVSTLIAVSVGLVVGIAVTRKRGRAFLPLAQDASSLFQTVPPVAVLALAVPLIGFGFTPTIVALVAYSVLPIIKNTIAGIESVPGAIVEASRGMGMSERELLFRTELPLSARVVLAGVRTSVVINVGTATVGATVGAGGLGRVIIAGLVRDNPAWTLTGAITAAALALLIDTLFSRGERLLYTGGA